MHLNYCDVGARGELPLELLNYEDLLSITLFEAETIEALALSSKWGTRAEVYRVAIGPKGQGKLSITANRGCSSLLDPNGDGRRHLSLSQGEYATSKVEIVKQEIVELQPLSSVIEFEKKPIDILKIDAQGFDYEILTTMGSHRPFIIKVEVSTVPIYASQRTMGTVLDFLESLGYMAVRFPFAKPHVYASSPRGLSISVGDLVLVPNFSNLGQTIISRNHTKWRSCLALFGFCDLVNHQESTWDQFKVAST